MSKGLKPDNINRKSQRFLNLHYPLHFLWFLVKMSIFFILIEKKSKGFSKLFDEKGNCYFVCIFASL